MEAPNNTHFQTTNWREGDGFWGWHQTTNFQTKWREAEKEAERFALPLASAGERKSCVTGVPSLLLGRGPLAAAPCGGRPAVGRSGCRQPRAVGL